MTVVEEVDVHQQNNSFDCGIYAIFSAQEFLDKGLGCMCGKKLGASLDIPTARRTLQVCVVIT